MNESNQNSGLKVSFETHGCRSNFADSLEIQSSIVEQGATPCQNMKDADVVVLNSCTVTNEADRGAIKSLKKVRRDNPDAKIVVTGCFAEVGSNELMKSGLVDVVVGPGRRKAVLDAIFSRESAFDYDGEAAKAFQQSLKSREKRPKKSGPSWQSISLDNAFPQRLGGPGSSLGELKVRARHHLRVQEGCENSCTFCIIPQSRGRLSSRSLDDVLDDLKRLSDLGYREVVLTGTHLGGYGEDIQSSLMQLLDRVAREQPVHRIRLSSIDPNDVSFEMIDLLSSASCFCEHLHICVQAFDDSVLKRMNRKYTMQEVVDLFSYMKEHWPKCTIGSDVIAGFPGETRKSVDKSIERFASLPISYLHVFPYSERDHTAAVNLPGKVEFAERKRRGARWRAEAERRRREMLSQLIGQELEMIAETHQNGAWSGTSREFAQVLVEQDLTSFTDEPKLLVGRALQVRAKSLDEKDNILRCELLSLGN